jgi:cobalt-factor III methyltransferase
MALEVPRSRLIAMQGPCSKELNEVLWKDWQIDCVVTKESGAAGGFSAKAEATCLLGIPLIVIDRPRINYPFVAHDFDSIIDRLRALQTGFEPSMREN